MKRTRIRRSGKSNRSKVIKKLDILWSPTIRRRDKVCQKCRKAPASQAAHIFSRNHIATRWDLRNGIGMCYYCHIIWAHRNPIEFADWITKLKGAPLINELRKKAYDKNYQFNPKDFEKIKESIS